MDDMTRNPIAPGEVRSGQLTFTLPGTNAKELLGFEGNEFVVSAEDIRKNELAAKFTYRAHS